MKRGGGGGSPDLNSHTHTHKHRSEMTGCFPPRGASLIWEGFIHWLITKVKMKGSE